MIILMVPVFRRVCHGEALPCIEGMVRCQAKRPYVEIGPGLGTPGDRECSPTRIPVASPGGVHPGSGRRGLHSSVGVATWDRPVAEWAAVERHADFALGEPPRSGKPDHPRHEKSSDQERANFGGIRADD
jgi:hypothetical protein